MPAPKYVKIKKDGVEYISGLDRCMYTISELSRAALRDVGKLVVKRAKANLPKQTGRARRATQYWVRNNPKYDDNPNVVVGYKQSGFYAGMFELGTESIKKTAPLYNAVINNVDEIRRIEGQYLSAIEDENKALALIDEAETEGGDEE